MKKWRGLILLCFFVCLLFVYIGISEMTDGGFVHFNNEIAEFVTHPIVVTVLLSLGCLGLVLELFTSGFGIPGFIGLSSLFLFFFGHALKGLAGWESFIFFGVGLILLALEVFLPGGMVGMIGLISVITGLVMAAGSLTTILIALFIALCVTAIGSYLFYKTFGYNGPLKKMVLYDRTTNEKGYVSNESRIELIGKCGVAITDLRPAGTITMGQERLDVVTEGSYIRKGIVVEIIKVEGSRIVVREQKEEEE
ncbi:NfeD family protein [Fictibacillus gelatini]|uniref:NfeD family protein n=1 Tax=Fictibacillus gelatini TaxID=225985 RepID=UPI000419FA00|nr:NfeD family protein [Fictibacillus gelatini]